MAKIFMSYSRNDQRYADKLAQALKELQVSGYLDTTDIAAGARWDTKLKDAIEGSDAVVMLLSDHGVKSNYVMAEVGLAWGSGKPIIPVIPPGATIRMSSAPPILHDLKIIDARQQSLGDTAAQIAGAVTHAEAARENFSV